MSGGLEDLNRALEEFIRLFGDDPTGEHEEYRQAEAERRTMELKEVVDTHNNSHVNKTIAKIEGQVK